MERFFNILESCPLFFGIERQSLERMLVCLGARIEFFDKKHTIMAEGTTSKYIGIVLSGSAQVIQIDYFGNRSILSIIEPSEVFAEAFACAETNSLPVAIVANEPCNVMLIDCSHILHTCTNNCSFHQQLIFNLMKDLATKTIQFHQRMDITSKRTTREKLLAFLTFQAKKEGKSNFSISFNRQELADYLEVDRSGLSSEIGKLKREGIIECQKNTFKLL